jgi:hypothetical protein
MVKVRIVSNTNVQEFNKELEQYLLDGYQIIGLNQLATQTEVHFIAVVGRDSDIQLATPVIKFGAKNKND